MDTGVAPGVCSRCFFAHNGELEDTCRKCSASLVAPAAITPQPTRKLKRHDSHDESPPKKALDKKSCAKKSNETLHTDKPIAVDNAQPHIQDCVCGQCEKCLGVDVSSDDDPLSRPEQRAARTKGEQARAKGHPGNQHALQATEKFFAKNNWKLSADDVQIDTLDKYYEVTNVCDKLKKAMSKNAAQKHAERVAEGMRRVGAMTMKLKDWQKANRQNPHANEMDPLVAKQVGLLKDEAALENEHDRLMIKLEKNIAKLKKVEEHKDGIFDSVVKIADSTIDGLTRLAALVRPAGISAVDLTVPVWQTVFSFIHQWTSKAAFPAIKIFQRPPLQSAFADFGNLMKMGVCKVVSPLVMNWLSIKSGTGYSHRQSHL